MATDPAHPFQASRSTSAAVSGRLLHWRWRAVQGLLALALLVGGAGIAYPVLNWLLECAALAVLALHLPSAGAPTSVARHNRTAWLLCAATLGLVTAQIVPLPLSTWVALPGRDVAANVVTVSGVSGWRAWSLAPDHTIDIAVWLLVPLAMLVAVAGLDGGRRYALVRMAVLFAAASAVLAVLQAAAGPDAPATLYRTTHRGVGVGLFVNRNHLALLLLIALPLLAVPAPRRHRGNEADRLAGRPLDIGLGVTIALGVVATLSRTGMVLLPVALAVALVLSRPRASGWRTVVLGGAGLAACGLLLWSAPAQQLFHRFATTADDKRFEYWANTWAAVRDSWPLGTGFGTFREVYQTVEPLNQVHPDVVNHAHNDVLELALEGGVAGLAVLAAWIVFAAWAWFAARQRMALRAQEVRPQEARRGRIMADAAIAAVVLALAASLVDYPLRMTALAVVVALCFGLLLPPVTEAVEAQADAHPRSKASAWVAAAILMMAALLSFVHHGSALLSALGRDAAAAALRPWSADIQTARATRLALAGKQAEASHAARQALAVQPLDAGAVRAEGMALLALGGRGGAGPASQGDARRGGELMALGARLGWRDGVAQLWLIEQGLAAGAPDVAVQRIDALLRQEKFGDELLPLLPPLLRTEAGRAALAGQLVFAPGWRTAFFNATARDRTYAVADLVSLLNALRRQGAPATPAETALIRAALADAGRAGDARAVWLASGGSGLLGDGAFGLAEGVLPGGGPPYDWRAPIIGGVRVEVAEPPAPAPGEAARPAKAVSIQSDGLAQGVVLAQRLQLVAGRYRIALQALPGDGEVLPRVSLQLACAGLAEALSVPLQWGSVEHGWISGNGAFEIGTDCTLVDLQFALRQRDGRPFSLWFDNIRIVSAGPSPR